MTKQIEHQVQGETVIVQLSILKKFEDCKEDMQSPFKHQERVMPQGFEAGNYENVFIKCEIKPEHRTRMLLSHKVSGESVCHEVVAEYLKEQYPGKVSHNIKTLFCNHFELQYQYVIV